METSILIVGVGGQGTLLTSRILGTLAQKLGMDVKVSEVHGMAQRGGSVTTFVRMGKKIASPIIEKGGADYVLALEMLEAYRYIDLVKPGGNIVVNTQEIDPMPVIMGVEKYPDNILKVLQDADLQLHTFDAVAAAKELGNIRVVNTLMIGMLAKLMHIDKSLWDEIIEECVPPKTIELNKKAFYTGYNSN